MTQTLDAPLPSTNGDIGKRPSGRNPDGRFAPGNAGGPGNPCAAAVGTWRAALAASVKPRDIQEVLAVLVKKAKDGEAWAVRELLDRCLGKFRPLEDEAPASGGLPADYLEFLESRGGGT